MEKNEKAILNIQKKEVILGHEIKNEIELKMLANPKNQEFIRNRNLFQNIDNEKKEMMDKQKLWEVSRIEKCKEIVKLFGINDLKLGIGRIENKIKIEEYVEKNDKTILALFGKEIKKTTKIMSNLWNNTVEEMIGYEIKTDSRRNYIEVKIIDLVN